MLKDTVAQVDIAVKDGKIAAIGTGGAQAKTRIDAGGLIVLPGMIDAHTHIPEPGRKVWEEYKTGTSAAAKGGITTVIQMPLNQLPCTYNKESLKIKNEAGKNKLVTDVASYGALVPYNLDYLEELSREGIAGYKAFMSACGDRTIPEDMESVDDYTLYEGMRRIRRTGKVLLLHCENGSIVSGLGKAAQSRGQAGFKDFEASRPVFAEVEAIRRAVYLAKQTGVKLHICHVSCPEGVDEVIRARAEGVDITCETCTHYLSLSLEELDGIGNLAKCAPPIRSKERQERLWGQVLDGEVLCVASDHSPCTPDLKEGPLLLAWSGISGLQNCMDILFDEAVQKRGMDLNRFADLVARKPAERFGLKSKGSIEGGKDADLTFIKPNSPYILTNDDLEYKNKISVYTGREIGARVVKTIVRGNVAYDIQEGVAKRFSGRFLSV